jgi:hypothetical protein
MKTKITLIALLLLPSVFFAQVGIGTTTPDASAKLEINATDKGFLPPRVALTSASDAATIATPAIGLFIYNTATAGTAPNDVTPGFYYYGGSQWQRIINQQPDGNLGIGTSTPSTKLEIQSATANDSGLKLTNLTSSSPVSSGATLGVDASGNVVTVQGSSFSPVFGSASPSGTVNIAAGANALLTSITIPQNGTYLINYTIRVQSALAIANQYAVGYLATANDNSHTIPGTEILGAFPGGGTAASPGGNYSGSHVITITTPTTIYFRALAQTGEMSFIDDSNGRTKITYVKITP